MDTQVKNIDAASKFIDSYQENKNIVHSANHKFLKDFHDKGIEDFIKLGFPEKKSERYKYTFLEPFFNKEYFQLLEPDNFNFNVNEIFTCGIPDLNTDVVLLVNGFYYHMNPINGNWNNNIWIGSLAKAVIEKPELIQKYLGKSSSHDDGLIALNSAYFIDGIFVHIPENVHLEKPLQIINVLLSEKDLLVHQRNFILLEKNSSADIVICDHTLSQKNFLTNSVTEIYVEENAQFNQTCLQNEHNDSVKVSSVFIQQGQNSQVKYNTITLHGGVVRNNLKVILDGEGAENNTSGLFITDKTQHVDNYFFINHAKPNCKSNQLIKGILDDQSTGSFNGRILVSRDAQKTSAYQKNNNLLLTSNAKMNTRPQLEIYADDVKCSHGATVGQLDQEALFYLRSRGIGKEESRLLLIFAFAHEIINSIQLQPLKDRVDDLVNKRLRGELTKCENCLINCC